MEILISLLLVFYVILSIVAIIIMDKKTKKENKIKEKGNNYNQNGELEYINKAISFKKLTQEQIDDIHSHGKITPEEKVKEWEDMGLCAPGDAIGSAAWRCKKFNDNCHLCLIDYASDKEEYTSFKDIIDNANFKIGPFE